LLHQRQHQLFQQAYLIGMVNF